MASDWSHLTGDVDGPEPRYLVEVSKVVYVRGTDGLGPGCSPGQAGLVVHDVLQGQRELRLVGAHSVGGVQVGLVTLVINNHQNLTIFADLQLTNNDIDNFVEKDGLCNDSYLTGVKIKWISWWKI